MLIVLFILGLHVDDTSILEADNLYVWVPGRAAFAAAWGGAVSTRYTCIDCTIYWIYYISDRRRTEVEWRLKRNIWCNVLMLSCWWGMLSTMLCRLKSALCSVRLCSSGTIHAQQGHPTPDSSTPETESASTRQGQLMRSHWANFTLRQLSFSMDFLIACAVSTFSLFFQRIPKLCKGWKGRVYSVKSHLTIQVRCDVKWRFNWIHKKVSHISHLTSHVLHLYVNCCLIFALNKLLFTSFNTRSETRSASGKWREQLTEAIQCFLLSSSSLAYKSNVFQRMR